MNRLLSAIATIVLLAVMAACGHSDTFRVHGSIDEGPDINLRFVYYIDGKTLTGITASNKGKFTFEAAVPTAAMVEIYDNEYRPLGRFIARNGEDFEITVNRSDRYAFKATGNEETALWTTWLHDNAETLRSHDTEARNAAVARFVAEHPASAVSLCLLATEFDASGHGAALADSLMGLLDPDMRRLPPSDALAYMLSRTGAEALSAQLDTVPYLAPKNHRDTIIAADHRHTLLTFYQGTAHRDSIVSALRRIHRRGSATVYDLSLDNDTLVWRRNARTDSATWHQGWLAAGVSAPAVDRVGIPSLPFFIVIDSAGRQLLRTPEITEAEQFIKKLK